MKSGPVEKGEKPEVKGVEDPTEYKQRHRIQSLLESRDNVLEQRRKALDLRVGDAIRDDLACRIVRVAVEEYILESENVIKHYLPDPDEEEPDEQEQLAYKVWFEEPLGQIEMVTDSYEFVGLVDYVDAPPSIEDRWTEKEQSAVSGATVTKRSKEYEIPIDISMNAYRVLNTFWHEMGMDIQMKHKLPTDKL